MILASLERLPASKNLPLTAAVIGILIVGTLVHLYWGRWLSPRYAPSRAGKGYMIAGALLALAFGVGLIMMYRKMFGDVTGTP